MAKTTGSKKEPTEKTLPKKDPEKLHEGHRAKMKARFMETGFAGFTEHQIVEMLLFYVYPRIDTNEIAHRLINHYGSLAGIIDASYDDLIENGKMPPNAAILFKIIPGIIPIYHNSKCRREVYDNMEMLKDLFQPYFVALDHEEFRVACFDAQLRLGSCLTINKGGPTGSFVNMRKLTEIVLKENAVNIAIAHNHPKGSPVPSPEDLHVTKLINITMNNIGVRLLDHIVVGENSSVSMRENAYIKFLD